ncbi:MAG: hypothetical protein IPI19_14555 [Ignavibacteriales bacterium]|nr:hypothetical protein [Ignavibacteriales bacterium]
MPVQLGREPEEKQDEKIKEFYRNLFRITKADIFRNGTWKLLETSPVADSDLSYENLLAWEWRLGNELRIVVVNYYHSTSRCRLKFNIQSKSDDIVLTDLLNNVTYKRSVKEISEKGCLLNLKPLTATYFHLAKQVPTKHYYRKRVLGIISTPSFLLILSIHF